MIIPIILLTGCSLTKDNLEDATIYTTTYPIKYAVEYLYGDYSTIDSIYPSGADAQDYEITDKKIKEYSKSDLFVYNGLNAEKNIAKNLINKNRKLLIIDASKYLSDKNINGIEELWMSPNNYLMIVKNIKVYLTEYLKSKVVISAVNEKYDEIAQALSLKDAALRALGKEAKEKNKNTIVVANNTLKFLEAYGFNIVSVDEETTTDATYESVISDFEKGTYKNLVVLDDNVSTKVNKMLENDKINRVNVYSKTNIDVNNEDYLSVIQNFIDTIRNITIDN